MIRGRASKGILAWGRGAARDGRSFHVLGDESLLLLSLITLRFCASLLFQVVADIPRPPFTYETPPTITKPISNRNKPRSTPTAPVELPPRPRNAKSPRAQNCRLQSEHRRGEDFPSSCFLPHL